MKHILVEAACKNDLQLLRNAIQTQYGVYTDDDVSAGLIVAANNGNTQCVELLLQHGADVNCVDPDGDTPLMLSACNNRMPVLNLLLQYRAQVDIQSNAGRTALHMACWNLRPRVVQRLLEVSADTDIREQSGDTALMLAARKGDVDIIKSLLASSCDVHILNYDSDTALHYASRHGHLFAVKVLVQSGSDVNAMNAWGCTPINEVVRGKAWDEAARILWYLIRMKADINSKCMANRTPLHYAAYRGDIQCVKILLENGALVNVADVNDLYPVADAVYNGHTEIVRMLLLAGALVDSPAKAVINRVWRMLPLFQIAIARNLPEIAHLLFLASTEQNIAKQALCIPDLYENNAAYKWLKQRASMLEPLTELCRKVIRKRCIRDMADARRVLPLPGALKDYLCLFDI